jgi:hypothetical protein
MAPRGLGHGPETTHRTAPKAYHNRFYNSLVPGWSNLPDHEHPNCLTLRALAAAMSTPMPLLPHRMLRLLLNGQLIARGDTLRPFCPSGSSFLVTTAAAPLLFQQPKKLSLTYSHPGGSGQLVPPAGAVLVIRKLRNMVGQYSFARLPTAVSPNRRPYR